MLLFKPGSPVAKTLGSLPDGAAARRWFAEVMPPLEPYLRDAELERFARRPESRLPSFALVQVGSGGPIHASPHICKAHPGKAHL